MATLIGSVLLFRAHAALAFNNPETGRWLSRDPIEEDGGSTTGTKTSKR